MNELVWFGWGMIVASGLWVWRLGSKERSLVVPSKCEAVRRASMNAGKRVG